MYNKTYNERFTYELPKIKREPYKKNRYVKYRPQTLQDWEELET